MIVDNQQRAFRNWVVAHGNSILAIRPAFNVAAPETGDGGQFIMATRLNGLWTATLTPVDKSYHCDVGRLLAHCRRLIEFGCDGIALFGTTGEGPEFSAGERMRVFDALMAAGFPAGKLIVSASAASLGDSIELARQATRANAAGVLLMPPFFFRDGI